MESRHILASKDIHVSQLRERGKKICLPARLRPVSRPAMNMPLKRSRFLPLLAASSVLVCLLFASVGARADDMTIKHPGDHPIYSVELEPHGILGWDGVYGGIAFGVGGRVAIPIVQNGFIPTINNSVAISFGFDWAHYGGCYYGDANCSADYFYFPVTMQWNFFLNHSWSVFGEPGLYIYHAGTFTHCAALGDIFGACVEPTETGVHPAFYAGARWPFSDNATLTMRVGFPTLSIGVSFFL